MHTRWYQRFLTIAQMIDTELADTTHEPVKMSHMSQVGFWNCCIGCSTKVGWDKRLGEILRQHGVDLQKFVDEVGGSRFQNEPFLFELVEGELKFTRSSECFYVARLHIHIARLLPNE